MDELVVSEVLFGGGGETDDKEMIMVGAGFGVEVVANPAFCEVFNGCEHLGGTF